MAVATPFFFVEHDNAWLIGKAVALFDLRQGLLENFNPHVFGFGRIERDREQKLSALRPTADRIGLVHSVHHIIRDEAANLVNLDALILSGFEKVRPELFCTAAL
jgi:hypothetical protein